MVVVPNMVLLTDRDVRCVTDCCRAEGIRQDFCVPSGQSGVRSMTPRAGSQTAPEWLKVGFYKHGPSEQRPANPWGSLTASSFVWQMADNRGWDHLLCTLARLLGWLSLIRVRCTDRQLDYSPG